MVTTKMNTSFEDKQNTMFSPINNVIN
jgi:hypothetical protein